MPLIKKQIETSISTDQVVDAFRAGTEACVSGAVRAMGGLSNVLRGPDLSLTYYTPTDDSPLSVPETDTPAFIIGCHVPRLRNAAGRQTTQVQMSVWDRGRSREVEVVAEFKMGAGGDARKVVDAICQHIRGSDSILDDATRFFANELKGVASVSVLGRAETLDEKALLSPLGETTRLNTSRAMQRCQGLFGEAMGMAAESSGWCLVEGVRLPRSWLKSYEDLANLDEGCPAIVALIERSRHGSASGGETAPSLKALEASEIAYGIDDWAAIEFTRITAEFQRQGIAWYVDDSALVVDARFESIADDLIAKVTGDKPV